jgi:hypothetical protein
MDILKKVMHVSLLILSPLSFFRLQCRVACDVNVALVQSERQPIDLPLSGTPEAYKMKGGLSCKHLECSSLVVSRLGLSTA